MSRVTRRLQWIDEGAHLRWLGSSSGEPSGAGGACLVMAVFWIAGLLLVFATGAPYFLKSAMCLLAFAPVLGMLVHALVRSFPVSRTLSLERGVLSIQRWRGLERVALADVREMEQFPDHLLLHLRSGEMRRMPMPAPCEETQRFLEAVRAQLRVAEGLQEEAAQSEAALGSLRKQRLTE